MDVFESEKNTLILWADNPWEENRTVAETMRDKWMDHIVAHTTRYCTDIESEASVEKKCWESFEFKRVRKHSTIVKQVIKGKTAILKAVLASLLRGFHFFFPDLAPPVRLRFRSIVTKFGRIAYEWQPQFIKLHSLPYIMSHVCVLLYAVCPSARIRIEMKPY